MRNAPEMSEVPVPRLVGLMAVDARRSAETHGVLLAAPDRPDLHRVVVEYVVRQYPPPGVEVPRGAAVTVWFDLGEAEGGGTGVREPRLPPAPGGGVRRELEEPRITHTPLGPFPQGPGEALVRSKPV
ncbi:PASTA domain-containing protein [Streptomyces ziwulingensis]|uniref:PASTA domain-containing protein n=1 Tax=Streptomyces ziwulingensis TaxID=1045501 RepID=A0ABP9AQ21_9ACTN